MVIKPRDKFKINTFVFTSQSDYDISELFVEVEAPNCTDNITHELSDCYHLYDKRIKSSLETDCAKNTFTYSYNVPHVYGSSVLIRLQCFSGNTSKSSRIVYSNKPLRLTISLNTVDFQWRGRCKVRLYAVRQSVEEPLLLKTHLYEKQCTASAEIPFWVLAVILVLFSLLILLGLTYLILKRLQPPKKLQNKKYIPSCTGTGTSCSLLQKNNYLTSNLSHSSVISQKVKKRTRVALLHFYKEEDILNLAHILQGKYGFDVVLDLWENNSIFPSYTDWIFNTVSTVDKIVVVWSEDASTAWRSRKSIIKKQEEDFFLTMLRVVQKRALLNQSLNMFFIVYFDQCQIQDIPSSFLQPPYNVFYLMEELQLLVYKLHPHRLSAT
uniref:uncharacterized protein LOC113475080 n=1 Tax=Ciona intestinalis TaxID=7719 RepID=UPI000EF4EFD0|nr:uncharacterized protein LOC113475080 [Ciona intestinalis]|eukprot:XP_026694346.1 uncharacterized protein LOC113475080 [Ciona intestinalis]